MEIPRKEYLAILAMGNGLPPAAVVTQMVQICVPRAIADPLGIDKPNMAKYIDVDRVGRFGRIKGKKMLESGEIKMAKTPTLKKIKGE